MALTAPRSLYELVACRFSSFKRMSGKPAPRSRRTSGVRTMLSAIRRRASRMPASVNGLTASSEVVMNAPASYWSRLIYQDWKTRFR